MKQRVVNIKLKDKQFVQINTNNENFMSTANILQRLNQGGCISTRNAANI